MASGDVFDVVVVGGGPAGLTAALVLARARRRVYLLDDGTYRNASVAEFHGFPGRDTTDPAELRRDIRAEIEHYGVEGGSGFATDASEDAGVISVSRAGGDPLTTRRLLLATGVTDELPSVEGLEERWGKSAFNCPFCDGWEYRDRPLVVLDAAPGAEDLAAMLRSWSSDVTIVPVDEVARLSGDGTTVDGVELASGDLLPAAAVFVRAPIRPRSDLAGSLGCELDENDFILTPEDGATSNPLVWAAGDVRRHPPLPHQVVLAAADGSSAAIGIHRSLL